MQTTCQDALPDTWKHDAEFVHDIKCGALTCEGLAHMSSVDYCSKDFLSGDLSKCVNSTDGRLQDFCRWSCKNCGERLFKIAMASYYANIGIYARSSIPKTFADCFEEGLTVDEKEVKTNLYRTKESCKRSCQAIGLCNAFVYEPSSKYCYIMNIHSKKNIKEAPGKIFGLKYCSGILCVHIPSRKHGCLVKS